MFVLCSSTISPGYYNTCRTPGGGWAKESNECLREWKRIKKKETGHNGYSPDKTLRTINIWRPPQSIQSNRPIICLRNDGLSQQDHGTGMIQPLETLLFSLNSLLAIQNIKRENIKTLIYNCSSVTCDTHWPNEHFSHEQTLDIDQL